MKIIAADYPSQSLNIEGKKVRVVGWPDINEIRESWDSFFKPVGDFSRLLRERIVKQSFKLKASINGSDPFEVTVLYGAIYAIFQPGFENMVKGERIDKKVPPSYMAEVLERLEEEFRGSPFVAAALEIWNNSNGDKIGSFVGALLSYTDTALKLNQLRLIKAFNTKADVIVIPYELNQLAQIIALEQEINTDIEILTPDPLHPMETHFPIYPLIR